MIWSPQEWKTLVLEHYGSIAAFNDRGTVEIMRQRIAQKRADNRLILEAEETHPGVVARDMLAEIAADETELASIDAALEEWLEKHPVSETVPG